MKYYEIVFSPTGGTKKVADALISNIADEFAVIDLCDREADFGTVTIENGDICIAAVPSYGGRVPAVAIQRLSLIRGNGAKVVPVAVYGNREQEDTLIELKDALDACGFVSIAAVTAIAEHSIARQFAAGRPDADDLTQLRCFAETIRERIASGAMMEVKVPGNRPYKEFKGMPMAPSANKSCVKCGICAEKCPVGAIPMNALNKTNKDACIGCMRCISVCPTNARGLNPMILAGVGQMLKKGCSVRKENALY